jgi:hypothetical protein
MSTTALLRRCLGLAALIAIAAVPATATGQSLGTESVEGSSSECVESFEIGPGQIMCARRISLDIDVDGSVSLSSIGLTPGGSVFVDGHATCLSVDGHVATVGVAGIYRQGGSGSGLDSPLAGLLRVRDLGGPNSGADTVEFAYRIGDPFGPPLPGPTDCSTFPGAFPRDSFWFPDSTNATGDLVVTDGPSVPSFKDQCKKGGWRLYGVFRNQGDCVSYVATKGKNPPGR